MYTCLALFTVRKIYNFKQKNTKVHQSLLQLITAQPHPYDNTFIM
jgi:hypothetical protein